MEIGRANRKRHAESGGTLDQQNTGGPLELEAIAAVHELSNEVRSIAVSEILPRTADLIFVNIKTVEGRIFLLSVNLTGLKNIYKGIGKFWHNWIETQVSEFIDKCKNNFQSFQTIF